MDNIAHKYDIAFSFLEKDEHLANQINDLIKDTYNTFLHSKKFEDSSNTKHEKTFIDVFGKQSKMVVVLFRNKWGTTPWTKIDENTIRNRAFDEDQNFLLFIPLDNPYKIPKYLPKVFIWNDLAKAGIKGAADIIEERIRLLTDKSKAESPKHLKTKNEIILQFEVESSKFLESVSGLEIADVELKKLFSALEIEKNKITANDKSIFLSYKRENRICVVEYGEFSIKFYLQPGKNNLHMDSPLYFELQRQAVSSNEPEILGAEIYHFELKKVGVYGWIKNDDGDSFISSKQLAEDSIKLLLSQSKKIK